MIFHLLKKELSLCMHATNLIFLAFCSFVFIPNYSYEVMFFFAGLSAFFVCLSARENQDLAFTCTLPVRKREIALARILFCVCFQVVLLLLAGACIAIKEAFLPQAYLINAAGSSANLALLGHGGVLLGVFNFIFFPCYFKNPNKVGIPFLFAAIAQFFIIILLVVLRYVAPVYSDYLVEPDPAHMGIKAIFLCCGIAVYLILTSLSCLLSVRRFEKTDV